MILIFVCLQNNAKYCYGIICLHYTYWSDCQTIELCNATALCGVFWRQTNTKISWLSVTLECWILNRAITSPFLLPIGYWNVLECDRCQRGRFCRSPLQNHLLAGCIIIHKPSLCQWLFLAGDHLQLSVIICSHHHIAGEGHNPALSLEYLRDINIRHFCFFISFIQIYVCLFSSISCHV